LISKPFVEEVDEVLLVCFLVVGRRSKVDWVAGETTESLYAILEKLPASNSEEGGKLWQIRTLPYPSNAVPLTARMSFISVTFARFNRSRN
jgi:hypothetical protein